MFDKLFSCTDAANLCHDRGISLGKERWRQLVMAGRVPARRTVGGVWVIEERDLEAFLAARETARREEA